MKEKLSAWGWVPLVAALIVAADQITKGWVETNVPQNSALAPFPGLESYIRIVHLTNTGAAFGLLQGQAGLFILIGLVVVVSVLVYARYLPADSWGMRLCLALQLGGAIGNLIDRLQSGRVTDFLLLSVPVQGRLLEWPAFNVADSSIVVGVIVMAYLLLRAENQQTSGTGSSPDPAALDQAAQEPESGRG